MLAFRSVMSALSSFVVRSFSTNSRPASGRPEAALGRQAAPIRFVGNIHCLILDQTLVDWGRQWQIRTESKAETFR